MSQNMNKRVATTTDDRVLLQDAEIDCAVQLKETWHRIKKMVLIYLQNKGR